MKHQDFDELLPAYYLGALSPAQVRRVKAHLDKGCPSCEAQAADLAQAVESLAFAAEEAVPPASIKASLMAQVAPPRPASGAWTWFPLWGKALAMAGMAWVAVWMTGRTGTGLHTPNVLRDGPAWVLRRGALLAEGKALAAGSVLPWGTLLSTGAGTEAQVQLGGGAIFLLKENSQVRLQTAAGQTELELPQGTLLSYVKAGHPLGLRSGPTHVSAEGTIFLVRAEGAKKAYVCVCLGRLRVSAPGLEQALWAKDEEDEHAVQVELEGGRSRSVPVKPAYYRDEEVDALKAVLD